MIKDFLNYFKSDARFIHKPNFIPEYRDENGLMLYSMDRDLIYWDGEKQIVTSAVWHGQPFLTNLASLPKWLHWIIKPDNKYIRYPSAQHDGDYDKHSLIKRVKADWRYLGALKAEKCPFILRWVFFVFVRVFGSRYRA